MTTGRKPRVLIVDDESEPAEALVQNLKALEVEAKWVPPSELTAKALSDASLVLLDLDLGTEATSSFPGLEPTDGLGLAAILRRQTVLHADGAPPVAFALLSGKVKELAEPFATTDRVVLLAKQHNLEWIFPKSEAGTSTASIVSLAKAVSEIPEGWANGIQDFSEFCGPFGIKDAPDYEICWEQIERCRPPTYEITEWTHGLGVVRWMLQKILNYPTFLWDSHHVAARLRISHASFLAALEQRTAQFRTLLEPAEYTGMLRDFSGRRWWRHRIERLAWEWTDGDSQSTELLRTTLAQKADYKFEPSNVERPLVCLDADYNTLQETYSAENAVRVQPDDWPAFADAAWMPIEQVATNKALRAIVVHDDRDRVPDETGQV